MISRAIFLKNGQWVGIGGVTFVSAELLGLGTTTHGVVEASEGDASLTGDDGIKVVHGS